MNFNHKNTPFFQAYPQIPLFPIYGYDNSEDAERDFDYMKRLYPRSSLKIQELIEDACDKLEYEGSIMFDEYPDRLQLAVIANNIYNQIAPSAMQNLSAMQDSPAAPVMASDYEYGEETEEGVSAMAFQGSGGHPGRHPSRPMPPPPPPWRPAPPPSNSDNPNWLRNLIEVMLCNEMCQRRRRYRSRKRWM